MAQTLNDRRLKVENLEEALRHIFPEVVFHLIPHVKELTAEVTLLHMEPQSGRHQTHKNIKQKSYSYIL